MLVLSAAAGFSYRWTVSPISAWAKRILRLCSRSATSWATGPSVATACGGTAVSDWFERCCSARKRQDAEIWLVWDFSESESELSSVAMSTRPNFCFWLPFCSIKYSFVIFSAYYNWFILFGSFLFTKSCFQGRLLSKGSDASGLRQLLSSSMRPRVAVWHK